MLQRTLPAGFIAPCLPSKTDKLPSGSQWLHEIKHDGFPDVGSKKRSVFRNLLSQPARSASN
jgi:ATP-dependent DNA ligase